MQATAMQQQLQNLLNLCGSATAVNRALVGSGLWARAEPNRIQMLMGELVAQQGVYEVKLPGSLWGAVRVGDEVTNLATGISIVVRWVDVSDCDGVPVVMSLLGQALSE